jgi:hypothetical protein
VGYETYSPVVRVEPASTVLAVPASLSLCFMGNSQLATIFLSRPANQGFERVGGIVTGTSIAAPVARFGDAFVANGVVYVDPPDPSCTRLSLLDARTVSPDAGAVALRDGGVGSLSSSVALLFRAEDCLGRPLTALRPADFVIKEDEALLSVEADTRILSTRGLQVFVSLVLDLSSSTQPNIASLISAAKAFVNRVQGGGLGVPVSIQLFAGDATSREWQSPTLDTAKLLQRLDDVATYVPADPASTNLNGAVIDAVGRSAAAQAAFRQRNVNGVFTAGYIILFTDGQDTTGLRTRAEAVAAAQGTKDVVLAVALQTPDFTPAAKAALNEITTGDPANGDRVTVSSNAARLEADFGAVAYRIAGLSTGSYLLGYCSPKRAGQHTVAVERATGTTQRRVEHTFSASTFTPGCSSDAFVAVCDYKECGGLACGACDDRSARCNATTLRCDSFCKGPPAACGGTVITNPLGYTQTCIDSAQSSSCGTQCVDLTSSMQNCGGCGTACPSVATCRAGACVCPTGQTACGTACVALTSVTNCGGCGVQCLSGGVCNAGTCACPSGQTMCGNSCAPLDTSTAHCGACGNACLSGASCNAGVCACPTGQINCAGVCTATTTTSNCGTCGNVCLAGQACSAGVCAWPYAQQAYVKASNTDSNDAFGPAVSLSADGNTLAVGAIQEASSATGVNGSQGNTAFPNGAVYVFVRVSGLWTQQAYIKASNTGPDSFGSAVSLSADGNTLAVGATQEASSATGVNGNQGDNTANASGAVYVFVRGPSGWSQQAYIKASNTEALDQFGGALALSSDGSTLAVGATGEDSNSAGVDGSQVSNSSLASGAVYVFTRAALTWTQQAYIKASNPGTGDLFGTSIALSGDGNTLGVGAPVESSAAAGLNGDQANDALSESGAAYLFSRSGTSWTQQAYIKSPTPTIQARFGRSVTVSRDGLTFAAGASRGGVQDPFGDMGAAFVYSKVGGSWSYQAAVRAANAGANDFMGWSLALSANGNALVVGALFESSNATGIDGNGSDNSAPNSGAAYLFVRAGSSWSQLSYLKASNTGAGDLFGIGVATSDDANTLVATARGEGSNATGVNGNQLNDLKPQSGAAYVFAR